jgi:hypothetical protein
MTFMILIWQADKKETGVGGKSGDRKGMADAGNMTEA